MLADQRQCWDKRARGEGFKSMRDLIRFLVHKEKMQTGEDLCEFLGVCGKSKSMLIKRYWSDDLLIENIRSAKRGRPKKDKSADINRRICRKCGDFIYGPNYFFCRRCFYDINRDWALEEGVHDAKCHLRNFSLCFG